MTTKFEADVAAAYKMVDERVEIICAVATALLDEIEANAWSNAGAGGWIVPTPRMLRLMAELRQVMR